LSLYTTDLKSYYYQKYKRTPDVHERFVYYSTFVTWGSSANDIL